MENVTEEVYMKNLKERGDEFYTQEKVVSDEVSLYKEQFENKIVYCNCDNPLTSNFFLFFKEHFEEYKLKKLIATSYNQYDKGYFAMISNVDESKGDTVLKRLPDNGSFDSESCRKLFGISDIIVTCPTFQREEEFIKMLIDNDKDFLIIANQSNLVKKDFCDKVLRGEIHIGNTICYKDVSFTVADDFPVKSPLVINRYDLNNTIKVSGIRWFTTLKVNKEGAEWQLELKKKFNKSTASFVDEGGIMNVNKIAMIPYDYDEMLLCPLVVLQHMDNDGFVYLKHSDEILKYKVLGVNKYLNGKGDINAHFHLEDKELFNRVLIVKIKK